MDLGVFHEIWDRERYTAGSIGKIVEGGVVVDAGAQVGLFSVFALKVLQARWVVSVEPDPSNFDLLSKNIQLNRIENATVVKAAVAGESGDRWIGFDSSNTGGHSFYDRRVLGRTVRAFSLTELFDFLRISECSLLKLDCEGAEMEIFESASDKMLNKVSAISLEYHLEVYPLERVLALRKRMEKLGFVVEVRPSSKNLGILRAIRRYRTSDDQESRTFPRGSQGP